MPNWHLLLEGEALPDTGISTLERGALGKRFELITTHIGQCEAIAKLFDATLCSLIQLQQIEGNEPTNQ